jgi:hypothetical protein
MHRIARRNGKRLNLDIADIAGIAQIRSRGANANNVIRRRDNRACRTA